MEKQILDHKLHSDPEMVELYKKYEKKALVIFILKNKLK